MSNTLQEPIKRIPSSHRQDAEGNTFHSDTRVHLQEGSALSKHYRGARFIDFRTFIKNHPKAIVRAAFIMGFVSVTNEEEIGF